MGYLKPKSGSINWKGQSIAGTATHDIARQGIAFSPEESEVFGTLTVAENIALPTDTITTDRSAQERIDLASEIFPKLNHSRERSGMHISGGQRKRTSLPPAVAMAPPCLIFG